MPYVNRDENNKISGCYARRQHEGQEFIDENNEEIIDFRLVRSRNSYKNELKMIKNYQLSGSVIFNGNNYLADTNAISILSIAKSLNINVSAELSDGTSIEVTPDDAASILNIIAERNNAIYARNEQLISEIDISESPNEIDLESGWPIEPFGL